MGGCINPPARARVNITSQLQDPEFLFFVLRVYYEKLRGVLKLLVPTFRPDLCVRSKNIAEKAVIARLKPILVSVHSHTFGYNYHR